MVRRSRQRLICVLIESVFSKGLTKTDLRPAQQPNVRHQLITNHDHFMWLDIIAFQSTVNPKGKRLESEASNSIPNFSTARLTRSYLLFETTTTGMPASRKSCNHWRVSGVPSGLFQAIKVIQVNKHYFYTMFFKLSTVIISLFQGKIRHVIF